MRPESTRVQPFYAESSQTCNLPARVDESTTDACITDAFRVDASTDVVRREPTD